MKSSWRTTPSSLRQILVSISAVAVWAYAGAAGCSSDSEGENDGDCDTRDGPPASGETLFAHVHYKDEADLQRVVQSYDVLEDADGEARWVSMLIDDPLKYEALVASGHRVDIVRREARHARLHLRSNTESAGIAGYPCYRTVEETHSALWQMASDYPHLAEVTSIGPSWKKKVGRGGYELLVLTLTNRAISAAKPILFVMGGLHPREYTTSETAVRFAEQMARGYGVDPDITWLLDHHELQVLPQANPDGRKIAEQGYYQRKNANDANGGRCADPPADDNHYGVDLNRNSSFRFNAGGSSADPCDEFYRGSGAASEPETDSLQKYLASIFADQRGPKIGDAAPSTASGVLITLHSFGRKVLYPWAWSAAAAPNAVQLATLGRKLGYLNGYTACQTGARGCLYVDSGSTDDWSYGELGIASYTIELGTDFFEKCAAYEQNVGPGNLKALLYAFKAARRPYQSPSGPDALQVIASPGSVVAGASVTLTATLDDTRFNGREPTQKIAAARYAVDGPSWSGGTTFAMRASDGAFDATREKVTASIDTTGWSSGRHIVLVEGRDVQGNWGVPSAVFVDVR
ncbi:peptidase M14 [Pendulispora rubella]|uniref:Peptidase M14 n=1 Tax=Pendulispora rubella TaxID=2741070 RepID=A0ABZ2KW03_9BACT